MYHKCKVCVLPVEKAELCEVCSDINQNDVEYSKTSDETLESQILKIKELGKGRAFDCIVGVSGGRDSTYLLYQLVSKHKLRCMAAYHRTPFTPEIIDDNVHKLVKYLNVPLVKINLSNQYHLKIAKGLTRLWFRNMTPIIANMTCAPCKRHNYEIMKLAKENNIRYLVMGSSRYEAFQHGSGHYKQSSDVSQEFGLIRQMKKLITLCGRGAKALCSSITLWRYIPVGARAVLSLSPDAPLMRFLFPDIKIFNYFFFTEWNEMQCLDILKKVGWRMPDNCITTWRADCSFAEVKNYMFKKMNGFNYIDAYFSNQIRAGILSRDEALLRMEQEGKLNKERLAEACKLLDLSTDHFTEIN